ncbi:plasma membrane intrinsic protein 3 [Actinidia rufa]|uniref:Plasma membrane intrinsic protein 3 n=1 Tax=Actinidia rufa TaxID=165716 RepID=A0A7J0ENJ5_9ERIC|nr:plasma membrane intrinsic protein 3 [Actinidia rufa]
MKDYVDPPLVNAAELKRWSFYRALIAKFLATFLFLYVVIATVIGHKKQAEHCGGGGILSIALAFGSMILVLVYCTAGNSGAPIDLVMRMGMLVSKKVTLVRVMEYVAVQCLGMICGVGISVGPEFLEAPPLTSI